MAQLGNLYVVTTDKDTHFTGAIAQNAVARENIPMPQAIAAGLRSRSRLKSITLLSDQNLDWEIWLFSRSTTPLPTDVDANPFIGRWRFDIGDGVQISAAGPYYYYIDGLDVPYEDADEKGELHLGLVPRTAGGKSAGAAGEVSIRCVLEPSLGW